jgi:hypothetical protein
MVDTPYAMFPVVVANKPGRHGIEADLKTVPFDNVTTPEYGSTIEPLGTTRTQEKEAPDGPPTNPYAGKGVSAIRSEARRIARTREGIPAIVGVDSSIPPATRSPRPLSDDMIFGLRI